MHINNIWINYSSKFRKL